MMYGSKTMTKRAKNIAITLAVMSVVFAVSLFLVFHLSPSAYAITNNAVANAVVNVPVYCQLSISNTAISFGAIPPATNAPTTNDITVNSVGNIAGWLDVEGTTWTSLSNTISVANTVWNPTSIAGYAGGNSLTAVLANTNIQLTFTPGVIASSNIYFGINIPANAAAGIYTQTITFNTLCGTTYSTQSTVTATVNVPYTCFITLSNTAISFGPINPGSNTPFLSNTVLDSNPLGSAQAQLLVSGGNWISTGINSFNVGNTQWNPTNVAYGSGTALTNSLFPTGIYIVIDGSNSIYYGVAVPPAQVAGIYTQNIVMDNSC